MKSWVVFIVILSVVLLIVEKLWNKKLRRDERIVLDCFKPGECLYSLDLDHRVTQQSGQDWGSDRLGATLDRLFDQGRISIVRDPSNAPVALVAYMLV